MELSKRNKWILLLVLSTLLLIISGVLIKNLPPTENKQSLAPSITPIPDTPVRVSLEGDVICLPHKDTSGPQTLECAFGLQTENGENYALDTALLSATAPQYTTGNRIKGNGVFVPIEQLSTDQWQKYDVKGIFSLTDGLEVLK